jgi:8-amino-7-oxononanoate synthase
MAHARSLDEYVTRRLRMAGGSMMRLGAIEESLDALKEVYLQSIDAVESERLTATGRFISFANYDYLGLGQDRRVRQAGATAAMELGIGVAASRLVGGNHTIHDALERELAAFLGVDDVITLVSGYLTNASLIGHLLTKSDQIYLDGLSHNSIMVGAEMSPASVFRFAHNDLDDLEAQLTANRTAGKRALIVVEGLYSMDGDIPDLPKLLELRDRHDAWLLVDEAHSIGVLGRSGRGICEHFGVDPREIDFIVGTLSKTFACSGGFIGGRRRIVDWLRFTLPAFVFSVGLSPVVGAAVREGLGLLVAEPWRVERLQDNARFFFDGARERGLNVGSAMGAAVVTIQFASHEACMRTASELLAAGYYVPPIPRLAVPKDQPRIRFFISALHTRTQITGALDVVEAVALEERDEAVEEFQPRLADAMRA